MGLYDRLSKKADQPPGTGVVTMPPPDSQEGVESQAVAAISSRQQERERNAELRARLHEKLLERISLDNMQATASSEELEARVVKELEVLLEAEGVPLSGRDRKTLIEETLDDVLRLGPIQSLIEDPTITEVMVNSPDDVWVEVGGRLVHTDVSFRDASHVRQTIDRIVSQVGRRIDESSPYVDARLPDGSRVNAVVPPIALDSPMLTIRKFASEGYSAGDLVDLGSLTDQAKHFLNACVRGRLNVLVSGGTGAGKTTTLNALSNFIPRDERIITVEDAAELKLQQPHVLRLETRPPNIEGSGEITIRDLVRNALRMRPDRIIVGEVRGGEALDMLQAMNTGHDGSISTVHANSPRDVLSRLETMVLMSGIDLPLRAIREQISSAIQLVVHQSRLADGSRRFTHISEITGMEGDTITLQDLFLFDFHAGRRKDGHFKGKLEPTGLRPSFLPELHDQGIEVDGQLFQSPKRLDEAKGW